MKLKIIAMACIFFISANTMGQQPIHTVPRVKDYTVDYELYYDRYNEFRNSQRYIFSFNEKELQTKRFELRWNSSTGEWRQDYYEDYIYDERDNLLEQKRYYYNPDTDTWIHSSKTVNTYDENNNRLTTRRISLNRSTNEWIPFDQTFYSYNSQNNRIESVYQLYDRDLEVWNDIYKRIFEYNNGLNIRSIYIERVGENWVNKSKTDFDYNTDETLRESRTSDWNSSSQVWRNPDRKTNYTYDANQNRILMSRSRYTSRQWNEYYKTEYNYDENGNQSGFTSSQKFGDRWDFELKRETEYYDDNFEKKLLEFKWNSSQQAWIPTLRLTYTENSVLGITEFDKNLVIYPNPVVDQLKIVSDLDLTNVLIYNSLGQKIDKELFHDKDNTIDFQNLSRGLYLLIIHTSNGKIIERVIKK